MNDEGFQALTGVTVREVCLALILLAVVTLVSYPVARYYWIKARKNAEIIRHWNTDDLVGKSPFQQ